MSEGFMERLDLENSPAQYVAQNLISEINENSDLTYDEEVVDEGFTIGPHSFEEKNGQLVKATMEGYKRESLVEIQELPFGPVKATTRVYDSPYEAFDKRTVSIGVEEPNRHRIDGGQEAQQAIYDQIREDWDVEEADKAEEIELRDSLILEYSWNW